MGARKFAGKLASVELAPGAGSEAAIIMNSKYAGKGSLRELTVQNHPGAIYGGLGPG
jgi:hypothetical protein